jgi:hypothetical protein
LLEPKDGTWKEFGGSSGASQENARAVEETLKYGLHTKEPKSERGNRTFGLDEPLVERLKGYLDQYKRLAVSNLMREDC